MFYICEKKLVLCYEFINYLESEIIRKDLECDYSFTCLYILFCLYKIKILHL